MPIHVPHLAITMGDPAGISAEIIVKAAARLAPRIAAGELRLLVIGHRSALAAAEALLGTPPIPITDGEGDLPPLALLPAGPERAPLVTGQVNAEGGRFAYLAVERAVRLAAEGRIDGIVTAPLNKEALNLAGHRFAGHTDMLASLTGQKSSVMMLAHGNMRVSHVTTHVPLEKVPALLTPERLRRTIDLTHEALRRLGIARPHIAIAALNPHAGEGGLFGREEIEIIKPAMDVVAAEGLNVSGPFGADTMFHMPGFDAFVVMLHDQGHIATKLLAQNAAAALTIGTPILFASVAHGTGHNIAGKGTANPAAMIEAVMRIAKAGVH